MTEWFEQWFGEEYLRLYPHRDEEEAARAIKLLDGELHLTGKDVLDLGCGPGRHAVQLAQLGARVVGFDLSRPLLLRARQRLGPDGRLVRGDMRQLPFKPASFDAIVNLFTSFGYFADDAQHAGVLREAATLLRPGGTFVLDYFNAHQVRAGLVPREDREIGTQHVVIERSLSPDDRFVEKRMHLMDDGRSFVERVRLFDVDDLDALFADAGLTPGPRFGTYDGDPAGPDAPRVILLGNRS